MLIFLLLALYLTQNVYAAPPIKEQPSSSMYKSISLACSNTTNYESYLDENFCKNCETLSRTTPIQTLTRFNIEEVLCLLYYESFVSFCAKPPTKILPVPKDNTSYSVDTICKSLSLFANKQFEQNVSAIITSDQNCKFACSDADGLKAVAPCISAYYFNNFDTLQPNKVSEESPLESAHVLAAASRGSQTGGSAAVVPAAASPGSQIGGKVAPAPEAKSAETIESTVINKTVVTVNSSQSNGTQSRVPQQTNIASKQQIADIPPPAGVDALPADNVDSVNQANSEQKLKNYAQPTPNVVPEPERVEDRNPQPPSSGSSPSDPNPSKASSVGVPNPSNVQTQNEDAIAETGPQNNIHVEPNLPDTLVESQVPQDNAAEPNFGDNDDDGESEWSEGDEPPKQREETNDLKTVERLTKEHIAVSRENVDDLDGESYFFSYFMAICVVFVLGYVFYHNRKTVFALVLEGKRGRRPSRGRRPNSANYHKLDSNLEEAISSSCTKNTTNIIY